MRTRILQAMTKRLTEPPATSNARIYEPLRLAYSMARRNYLIVISYNGTQSRIAIITRRPWTAQDKRSCEGSDPRVPGIKMFRRATCTEKRQRIGESKL